MMKGLPLSSLFHSFLVQLGVQGMLSPFVLEASEPQFGSSQMPQGLFELMNGSGIKLMHTVYSNA